jgi:hypothetical protein
MLSDLEELLSDRGMCLKSEVKELVLVLLLVLENANVSPSEWWNKMITGESDPFLAGPAR